MAEETDIKEVLEQIVEQMNESPQIQKWVAEYRDWFQSTMQQFGCWQFILDDNRRPVAEPDFLKFAEWMETHDKVVAKTYLGDVEISTVFLGLDHNFIGKGEPVVFETMVFGGEHDLRCRRYTSWEEAETGHAAMVELVKATLPDPWPDDLSDL